MWHFKRLVTLSKAPKSFLKKATNLKNYVNRQISVTLGFPAFSLHKQQDGKQRCVTPTDSCIKRSNKRLVLTKPKPYVVPLSQQAEKALPLLRVQVTLHAERVGLVGAQTGASCLYSSTSSSSSAAPQGRQPGAGAARPQPPKTETSRWRKRLPMPPAPARLPTETPVSWARCSSGGKRAALKHLCLTLM